MSLPLIFSMWISRVSAVTESLGRGHATSLLQKLSTSLVLKLYTQIRGDTTWLCRLIPITLDWILAIFLLKYIKNSGTLHVLRNSGLSFCVKDFSSKTINVFLFKDFHTRPFLKDSKWCCLELRACMAGWPSRSNPITLACILCKLWPFVDFKVAFRLKLDFNNFNGCCISHIIMLLCGRLSV